MRYEKHSFRNEILSSGINELVRIEDLNESADYLLTTIKNIANKFKTSIKCVDKSNVWFTDELRLLKNDKINSYLRAKFSNNLCDWEIYKEVRNKYKDKINKAKDAYIRNTIENTSTQKGKWQFIKRAVLNESEAEITKIQFGSATTEDRLEIANNFNHYFIDSITKLNQSIPDINYENHIDPCVSRFTFRLVNVQILKEICMAMNKKKDYNGLDVRMIMDNWDILSDHLANIINRSLSDGEFPSTWKESIVVPVPKLKNTIKCEEFRPVNMLGTFEKILEKVVQQQFEEYLEKSKLIMKEQSGFRKKHSCESAINLVIEEWKEEMSKHKFIIAVFLDFKRAFETIDRTILIKKLEKYGIVGRELRWFQSYLLGRTQRTRFDNIISEARETMLGVPQGSVLGTLLFTLYINDMERIFKYAKPILYADDTLIYISEHNEQQAKWKLKQDLDVITNWLKTNKLLLNLRKTKCMVLNMNNDIDIEIDGQKIENVNEIKYLGVIIDRKLNFSTHIDYICKKIGKKINFFRRIRSKMSFMTAIQVHNSIIRPHFEYCSTILFLSNQTAKDRIQKLQNKAMRCILKCNRYTPITGMLETLKWMNCKDRIEFNVLKFIFNIKNGHMPEYLREKLSLVCEVQPYNLRGADVNYRVGNRRTSSAQNSLLHKGLQLFNQLPVEIKREGRFANFKRGCLEYIRNR